MNTRHYLCCHTHLLQSWVMSGGASSSWKEGDRDFLKSKKVKRLFFPYFFYFSFFFLFKIKDSQICICYSSVQISKNSKGFLFHVLCFCLALREGGDERWGCTSVWVVEATETVKCEFPNFSFWVLSGKRGKKTFISKKSLEIKRRDFKSI